jgi:hypothetical protein
MRILGIDAGFSTVKDTSAYMILEVNAKNIQLVTEPTKFVVTDAPSIFNSTLLKDIDIITIDAPMTSKEHLEKPKTGRTIDKAFSGGKFTNSKRGPQPGSISTPKQGWPLYVVGMKLKMHFEMNSFTYISLVDKENKSNSKVVLEVIPKLSQSLLLERNILVERPKNIQIDNHLFSYTFDKDSVFLKSFGDYKIDNKVHKLIDLYKSNTKKYHEELAALIAALQGVLFAIDSYSIVGVYGEYEGSYLLPSINYWNDEWKAEFFNRVEKYKCLVK